MLSGGPESLLLIKNEQLPEIVIKPDFMPSYGKDVMN